MAGRDCVLFLTHRWSPSIAAHYQRLRQQVGDLLDVLLVYQGEAVPAGMTPDIVVTDSGIAATFPGRLAEAGSNWTFLCADLAWMTAAGMVPASGYERVWMLEYDVDFSGDWATFFGQAVTYDGDLLGVDLRPLSVTPGWWNAGSYRQPAGLPEPLIGFFPIVCASRALIEAYRSELEREDWGGHFEMVLPSFAASKGFLVREIGGDTDHTPAERRGLHYKTPRMVGKVAATFTFRPPRSFRYYVEAPGVFRQPDRLYHPVKSDLPLTTRLAFRWKHLGDRWVLVRNRLLRRDPPLRH